MTAAETRRARRDARELAATRPVDPYRGGLTDPFTALPPRPASAPVSSDSRQRGRDEPSTAAVAGYQPAPGRHTPGQAVLAGILAIGLGATTGLFGLLLLAIISLQEEYGAPDRSFYQGSDSNYLLLALLDFGLGAGLVAGGISLLTGRLSGRVLITAAGWAGLVLCAFWWVQSSVTAAVPLAFALLSLGMLMLSYQASVTRWLGVLPAAQPE